MESHTAVASLGALAHDTRLAVFRHLVRAGEAGAPVAEIRDVLGVVDATLSFHLAALKHAGLLQCRRRGRQLFYRVDYDRMRELLRFLTEDCCGGRPEICAGFAEAADVSHPRRTAAAHDVDTSP